MTERKRRSGEANILLEAALRYAGSGYAVFPLVPRGKKPITRHGFKDASIDPAQIRQWWAENPKANIGSPTGADTFDVLDVDKRNGGYDSLAKLLIAGTLPAGPVSDTGGGGEHIALKHVPGIGTRAGFLPGLDFKSDAGYVVLPPSIHHSGKRYEWRKGQELGKVGLPDAPAWLVQSLQQSQPRRRKRKGPLREGERNDQLFRAACSMRRGGLEYEEILEALEKMNASRCKPPLEPRELHGIAQSARRYELSPSTTPIAERHVRPKWHLKLEDFWAHMPSHKYVFGPTRDLWPGSSVDVVIPPIVIGVDEDGNEKTLAATTFLDRHRHIEQMTWCPGQPMVIEDRLVADGGWIERKGCRTFNLYRPRTIVPGKADAAGPWLELLKRLYAENYEHILRWFASRVQKAEVKINHALVLGGTPGIGKDTIMEPLLHAVGPWNFKEASPTQLTGRFNNFVKSVILRVSEAHDLGDDDRRRLYDSTKTVIAAPPDTLRCDEKFVPEYPVFNVCGVVMTTNHRTQGIYLPPNDRRHFVAWSECNQYDFEQDYWTELYRWYHDDGFANVTAYLDQLDLSDFDPKAPPPKTEAFWALVEGGRNPEDLELVDVVDALGKPKAVTIDWLAAHAQPELSGWLLDHRHARQVRPRLEAAGYVPVRNDGTKDGRWKVEGQNRTIYARVDLPAHERRDAALHISRGGRP